MQASLSSVEEAEQPTAENRENQDREDNCLNDGEVKQLPMCSFTEGHVWDNGIAPVQTCPERKEANHHQR
jgi:hypothetical protein